jgi:hypothetical protein
MGQRALRITMEFDKSSMRLQGYTHLEEANETSDSDNVMKDTLKVILDIYILARG